MSFNFLSLDPLGFSAFTISGIDPNEMLDPDDPFAFIAGVEFTSGGTIVLNVIPIVTDFNPDTGNNVPEPATLALMGLGLAGLGFTRRKKV